MRPSPGRLAAALACVTMSAAAAGTLAAGTHSLYWGDVLLYFEPLTEFVRSELRSGRLPLWNPYVLCGQPIVGNPQSMVFYPTTALLPMLSPAHFIGLTTALAVAIACTGTYRYLRALGLQRLASIFGACSFAGSFAVIGRLQFPTMLHAIAWMPWVLWATLRCAKRPGAGRAAALGVAVALSLTSGHPQVSYMTFAAAGAHLLAFAPLVAPGSAVQARRTLSLFAGAIMGVALSTPYWLPVLQMLQHSSRVDLALDMANRFVLLPEQLVGFVAPRYFGSPATGDYWGAGNLWEPAVYLGLPQLAVAAYAVCSTPKSPRVRAHALMAVVWLWLALGAYAGLFAVAHQFVPGMSGFHDPARFAIPAVFSLAALAGLGLERAGGARAGVPWLAAASVVLLLAAGAGLTPTVDRAELRYRPRALGVAPHGRRIYTAERQDIWDRYVGYADYGPESGRYVHELTDTLAPNIGMRYNLEEAGGYEPVPLQGMSALEGVIRGRVLRQDPGTEGATAMVDAGLVIWPLYTRVQHPALQPVRSAGLAAYRTRTLRARAWVVHDIVEVPSLQRARAVLSSPHFDARASAVVLGRQTSDEIPRRSAWPSPPRADAVVTARQATSMLVELPAMSEAGLLVVSAAAYPGWYAEVDGRHAPVRTADAGLLGVNVPPGAQTVVLRYRPSVVRVSMFVGLAGLTAIISVAVAAARPSARRLMGRYTYVS